MPHLVYTQEELEQRHPKLEAPDEELLDSSHEAEADARDSVLQHGLSVARQIEEEITRFGRTRRTPTVVMRPLATPSRLPVETPISVPQHTPELKGAFSKRRSARLAGRTSQRKTSVTVRLTAPGSQTAGGVRSYVLLRLLTAFLLRLPAVQGPALGAFSTLLTFEFPIVRARRTIQFQSRNDCEGLGVKR